MAHCRECQTHRGGPCTCHLYNGPGANRAREEFEKRYGKKHGDYVYGATVGKVKRERQARGR